MTFKSFFVSPWRRAPSFRAPECRAGLPCYSGGLHVAGRVCDGAAVRCEPRFIRGHMFCILPPHCSTAWARFSLRPRSMRETHGERSIWPESSIKSDALKLSFAAVCWNVFTLCHRVTKVKKLCGVSEVARPVRRGMLKLTESNGQWAGCNKEYTTF